MVEQYFLPAAQVGQGPVAVDAFHAGDAVFGDFFEETFDDGGGGVVGVDQDGEVLLMGGRRVLVGHGSSLKGDGRPYCEMMAVRHCLS